MDIDLVKPKFIISGIFFFTEYLKRFLKDLFDINNSQFEINYIYENMSD